MEPLERAVPPVVDAQAVDLTHPVDDDYEAFLPAGGEVGAGRMGEVMIDVNHALVRELRERVGDLPE